PRTAALPSGARCSAIPSWPRPFSTACCTTRSWSRSRARASACASTPSLSLSTYARRPSSSRRRRQSGVAGRPCGGNQITTPADHRAAHLGNFNSAHLRRLQPSLTVSVGTDVTIVQEGLPDVIPVEACYLGWQQSLANL